MSQIKSNSIALVTGASGSIGSAISKTLNDLGYYIILSGTNEKKLQAVQANLNTDCTIKLCNLDDLNNAKNLINEIKNEFGKIDALICNAGITGDAFTIMMSDAKFHEVIKVNLESTFVLNRETVKLMMRNKQQGRIVNISSVVGLLGNIGQANYCASKAGLIGMTKAIAREVAEKNITVNTVAPGFIKSDMTANLPETIKEKMLSMIPIKRFGTANDVANAVAYLCSDSASYITGSTLHINGGMFMN